MDHGRGIMAWSNYATICRLCLQQDGFLLAIFNNHSAQTNITASDTRSIQKKIAECTALELSSGDGLPPCVCHRCLYKVELCLDFRRQCLVSDATLRQISVQLANRRECNGEVASDQDSEVTSDQLNQSASVNNHLEFSQSEHSQGVVEDVVMVVDPNMDYDSENDSDYYEQHNSDNENANELTELKNVFMCKYCDKAYTIREECRSHEGTDHDNEIPFRCSGCDMGFADRTNYTAHQKSVHGNDKPFGCPQCERSFSRRSDLRKHTVVHTGIKPFTCNICFKSFSRNTNLTKHLRIHSGHKPYVCPQCPKTFISKGDLTRHAIIHTGHKPYACNYCDQSFGRRDKLIRHEKRHFAHNGGGDQAPTFSELEALRRQLAAGGGGFYEDPTAAVKQELPDDEPPDEDCDRESWSGENMVISVDPFSHDSYGAEPHPVKEEAPSGAPSPERECPPGTAADLPRVPEHITGDSSVTAETPPPARRYPCLVCRKRFPSAGALREHAAGHSSQAARPHACALCSKSFLRKRELDRHVATHTGMKPFKCGSCDKRFGRKDKLVRHARIHDASKAHVCPLCGATFARKDGLASHARTHGPPPSDDRDQQST